MDGGLDHIATKSKFLEFNKKLKYLRYKCKSWKIKRMPIYFFLKKNREKGNTKNFSKIFK